LWKRGKVFNLFEDLLNDVVLNRGHNILFSSALKALDPSVFLFFFSDIFRKTERVDLPEGGGKRACEERQ